MKRTKQLLAVLLAACMLCSLCVFQVAALSTQANRAVTPTVGATTFTLTDESVISVMQFIPGEAGVYEISLEGAILYRVYGSMAAGYFYNYEQAAENVLEIEIKESMKNSPLLLGAAGNGTATLTIARQGDASFDINALPYETYQHTETLTKFDLPDDVTLTYVDVTTSHTAVKGADGYYHLDSADGYLLYFDFANSPYLSISAAAANGAMKDVIYDENGNFLKKEEYITCINTYYGYTDNSTNRPVAGYTDKGIYPLTDDLVYIMQTHTACYGWNDATSQNYLFVDEVVDADTAWMFPVCYDGELLPGGVKNPTVLTRGGSYTAEKEGGHSYLYTATADGIVTVSGTDAAYTLNGEATTAPMAVTAGDVIAVRIPAVGTVWTLDVHTHSWQGTTCTQPLSCACGAVHPQDMGPHSYDAGNVCTVCGNDELAAKLVIGSASGLAGDTVEVSFTLENLPALKALALSGITYDKTKLELVSGGWSVDGVLSDFDTDKPAAVIAFKENTDVNTVVFTLTFRIKNGVSSCELPVSCNIVAKTIDESGSEVSVPVLVKDGIVTAVLRGDMNGDGVVNTDDAVYLLYHVSLPAEYPANQSADMNGDNQVDGTDAIYLLYFFLLPDLYPLV